MTTPRTINTQEPGKYHAQKTVGGWVVIFVQDRHNIRNVDGGKVHESRQNAYAKRKRLNDELTPEKVKDLTMKTMVLSEQAPEGYAGPQSWSHGTNGTEMVTWLDGEDGKWYGCYQGQGDLGWFESEDAGPFDSREEAEAYLREDYAESQQPQPNIYPSEDE